LKGITVPEDDIPIIKAALATGGNTLLVTTNRRHILENEELKNFLSSRDVRVVSPNEALSLFEQSEILE